MLFKIGIIWILLIILTFSIKEVNQVDEYKAFVEQFSNGPILHIFYDKSYKKTTQFKDLLQILEETEEKMKDIAKIIMTNCNSVQNQPFEECQVMKANNDNKYISGIKPSDIFLDLANKKLQKSPSKFGLNDYSDNYRIEQFIEFLEGLTPNYFTELYTQDDLNGFLNPRYVPKLIYFSKEDEVPINIKKISVAYNLRFDMAIVEDLCQEIVKFYEIKKFPTLMLLVFNYETKVFDRFFYRDSFFDFEGYVKLRSYLADKGLKNQRNDILFHHIPMVRNEIMTVDNLIDLEKIYDAAQGWIFTEEGRSPSRLIELKKKYVNYFSYVHYKQDRGGSRLTAYNPLKNESYVLQDDLKFNALDLNNFMSNISTLIRQNYTVLSVREKYSYICALTMQVFFRGLVECFIIQDKDYPKFSQVGKIQFQYGFIAFNKEAKLNVQIQKLKEPDYKLVYTTLQYIIKLHIQDLMINFMKQPIKKFQSLIQINELCNDIKKKCVIALLDSTKPETLKTELSYLQSAAQAHFNDYTFFWVDKYCNSQFINKFKEPKLTLVIYVRKQSKYLAYKQRLGKSSVQKFLKKASRVNSGYKYVDKRVFPIVVNNCQLQNNNNNNVIDLDDDL